MAFVWELTKETIYLPLGCLQGGPNPRFLKQADMNGKVGRLGGFYSEAGRYVVALDTFGPGNLGEILGS